MIRAPNVPTPEVQRERLRDAARSLEAMVLKHLVTSSGAFKGGDGPGAAIRGDLFATTLADALAKGGGVGLAAQLERTLTGDAEGAPAAPSPLPGALRARASAGSDPELLGQSPELSRPDPEFHSPLAGRISSRFGMRADPFTGAPRHHGGVDIAAPEGSTFRAARPGRVVFAGERGGYGTAVELDHGDGVTTLYAHASALLVREGDRVAAGQPIGQVGTTGRATGPHLHFEVRHGTRPQDPGRALNEYRLRADEKAGAGS